MSLYQASVPVLTRALNNLAAVLTKGAAHAKAKSLEDSVLTQARLFPDMFPLARQVQIACDIAKGGVARLAGVEPVKFEDTEVSFAELLARVAKTTAYLAEFKPEQIDGQEQRPITLPMRSGPVQFIGLPYLQYFVLPNVYFHSTTTSNLLRHNGVEVGKMDFLGGLN